LNITKWVEEYFLSNGLTITQSVEYIQTTPWSSVTKFITNAGAFYLKQTPPALFLEPKIMQFLANQLSVSVPDVIASNDTLHCFLMKDAGINLRKYLKIEFHPDLLCQAIRTFTHIQRSAENHIESFLAIGVPDWRLDKLPKLYEQLINQTAFLKAEGMADEELQILHDLGAKISEQCAAISQFKIPETLVQPDFNTNNILFDSTHEKMTLIDLGEIAITHPFFSLHNFLLQATIHHGMKEQDPIYCQLKKACYENWLALTTEDELLDAFLLVKKLWPIYAVLAYYRLMISVDQQALKSYYANRSNQLVSHLRKYIYEKY
jgi:hypothetical protein